MPQYAVYIKYMQARGCQLTSYEEDTCSVASMTVCLELQFSSLRIGVYAVSNNVILKSDVGGINIDFNLEMMYLVF